MKAEINSDLQLNVSIPVESKSEDAAKEEAAFRLSYWSHASLILYDYHNNKYEFKVNDLKALLDSLEYFAEDE